MPANSYLIFSPAAPDDTAEAAATQRQTIPFVWALAAATPRTQFNHDGDECYFSTTVGDALATLDRGMASWNYNSYFRDTLAPVGVFRTWLANYPSETTLYLNITELIAQSPNRESDIAEMQRLSEKVLVALEEIEKKHFTVFLQELRRLSYPFITVPITGDRELDIEILTSEIRDTPSVEAEMALQMVGVDRDGTMLNRATESIKLRRSKTEVEMTSAGSTTIDGADKVLTIFATDLQEARRLFVEELGATVIREGQHRLLLNARGSDFMLVQMTADASSIG
jgi:hypothetical protein